QESFKRPVVLMIERDKAKTWLAANCRVTDMVMDAVVSVATSSQNRIHFGSRGNPLLKDTVAWIPLTTPDYRGGIYVTCLPSESPFSEKEMEFLTVVGVIANRMLDQLSNRRQAAVQPARMQEFHGIIGASKAIREVYSHIEIAAGNTATVLIEGES